MILFEDLEIAYEMAKEGHTSSKDYVDFMINEEYNLRKLYKDLQSRTFQPSSYAFITTRPRPREVFGTTLPSRIIHNYIDLRTRDILESVLTPFTYNNRVGYGTLNAVLKAKEMMERVSNNFTKDAYIIKLDFTGFFPNADMKLVHAKMHELVDKYYEGDDKEDLFYMLEVSYLTDPTVNCKILFNDYLKSKLEPEKSIFNKPTLIGAAIGYLCNQSGMNLLINEIDEYIAIELGIEELRFVDDIFMVTDDKAYVLNHIPEIRRRAALLGCKLSDKKFYCQHISKGAEFLGFHLIYDRSHLNNRILARMVSKIYHFNNLVSPEVAPEFQSVLNSYLGMCKRTNDTRLVNEILMEINAQWLKILKFNGKRRCFQLREEYSIANQLQDKYNYKSDRNNRARY